MKLTELWAHNFEEPEIHSKEAEEDPEKAMVREFYKLKVKEHQDYIEKVKEVYGSVEHAPSRVLHDILKQKEFLIEYALKKGLW